MVIPAPAGTLGTVIPAEAGIHLDQRHQFAVNPNHGIRQIYPIFFSNILPCQRIRSCEKMAAFTAEAPRRRERAFCFPASAPLRLCGEKGLRGFFHNFISYGFSIRYLPALQMVAILTALSPVRTSRLDIRNLTI
jgi:hypothetical protein